MFAHLLKVFIFCVLGLVLYGAIPSGQVTVLLGLFVIWRFLILGNQWLQKPISPQQWLEIESELIDEYQKADHEKLEEAARELQLETPLSADELALAHFEHLKSIEHPTRLKKRNYLRGHWYRDLRTLRSAAI